MKLTELHPRWYVLHEGGPRVGFTFDCPHCRTQRIGVALHDAAHRILVEAEPDVIPPGSLWEITGGKDFNDLSLMPSLDASGVGHWHGFITEGKIR